MNSFGKRTVNSRPRGLRLPLALALGGLRQPQAGPTLRAALADVDAVEALGQPRQVLGRDAGTMVAHRDARFAHAIGALARAERDLDPLVGGAVFQRVLEQ